MAITGCNCCIETDSSGCPVPSWLTLHKWKGNRTISNDLKMLASSNFRLSFTYLGSTETTGIIPSNATKEQIKSALEVLPNIGTSITVLIEGGFGIPAALPTDTIWIWFDSPLTNLQDVPLLEVLDNPEGWEIGSVREGSEVESEIQFIKRRPGVWEVLDLDKYSDLVWQWRVVVLGTAREVPDLTDICVQQNRKEWRNFVSPIRKDSGEYRSISCTELRWGDSSLLGSVTGGTFTATLTIGMVAQAFVFPWNVTAAAMAAAFAMHPDTNDAGTMNVTGGPFPDDPIVIGFIDPITTVMLTYVANLVTTPQPTPITVEMNTPNLVYNYDFPVTGGSYRITATDPVTDTIQTTAAIPHDAQPAAIEAALSPLSLLWGTVDVVPSTLQAGSLPTITDPVGVNEIQEFHSDGTPIPTVVGGVFRLSLTVNGMTALTGNIPHNATPTMVYAAVRSMPNMLPTDDLIVSRQGVWGFKIQFTGTLGSQNIPMLGFINNLVALKVKVTITGEEHFHYTVTWLHEIPPPALMWSVTSNLISKAEVEVTSKLNDTSQDFQSWLEPLNVGTIWSHYIRSAWGKARNRAIQIYRWLFPTYIQRAILEASGGGVEYGPIIRLDTECGMGFAQLGGCMLETWFLEDYPTPGQEFEVTPRKNSAGQQDYVIANFDKTTGTVTVSASGPLLEFAFQIRCLGCHYSSSFNLLGQYEQSLNAFLSVYDETEPQLYEPPQPVSGCAVRLVEGGAGGSGEYEPDCRRWRRGIENVPFNARYNFGPDGFDVHLINDKFTAEGTGHKTRKPPCDPDVVLFSGGYWLETQLSPKYPPVDGCNEDNCLPQLWKDWVEEHPTSDVDRLKMIFGTQFSYWGGWIDIEHSVVHGNKIRCKFDQFDLTDIKVMILGGLPVRSQRENFDNVNIFVPDVDSTNSLNEESELIYHDWDINSNYWLIADPNPGTTPLVHKEFEVGTLEPLRRWLQLHNRVLLLDGGVWPTKFLAALGLTTTMETFAEWPMTGETVTPNTLNGSLRFGHPNVGGFNPQPSWYNGNPVWGMNPYIVWPTTNQPADLTAEPEPTHPFNLPQPLGSGTGVVGAIVATKNYHAPSPNVEDPIYDERDKAPAHGLRSYTTAFPKVVPGPGASVVASCKGEMAVHPWYDVTTDSYYKASVDYPAIVSEPFTPQPFKLRFTHGGVTADTGPLLLGATATDIQNALMLLPNIGTGTITVVGGPLPGSIDVYFDNLTLAGLDVALMEVVDSDNIQVEEFRKGEVGVDEIQRITSKAGPSRVVITGAIELVLPDAWGQNYRDPMEQHSDHGRPIRGIATLAGESQLQFCHKEGPQETPVITTEPQYNKNGYGWGKGLTYICSEQFLRNLLRCRDVY